MHVNRRHFLTASAALCATAWLGRASSAPVSAGPADPGLIADLVAANRILARQEVVDGYGHVSVRHHQDPQRFLISRSLAPESVSADDIVELDLDGNQVEGGTRKLYLERFIHGAIYQARPDVKAVVHHHSAAVIPFSVTKVPLRAVYHMAAFVAAGVPVFEIRDTAGMTDMLISTPELGRALAATLGEKPAALMRGHGAVVVGTTLPEAVARSVYLQMNARLQQQVIALGGEINYLDPQEANKIGNLGGYDRAWELWKRKVSTRP